MSCQSQCYTIGGPWIAEDPNCPIHGSEAQRAEKERDEERRTYEERLSSMQEQIDELRADLDLLIVQLRQRT